MREFLRGWRRKAGCVTLLMACVFATGWVRSFYLQESLCFPTGDPLMPLLISINGEVGLIQWYDGDDLWPNGAGPQFSSNTFTQDNHYNLGKWTWCCCGVGIKGLRDDPHYVISYWSITIPLTLLSAYLILWKPRKRVNRDA